METNTTNIEIGDLVQVTFPWREDETPNADNFHQGICTNIYTKDSGALQFVVEGLDRPVYADRIKLIDTTNLRKLPVWVNLTLNRCETVYEAIDGDIGLIVGWNIDQTKFNVYTTQTHAVKVQYKNNAISGNCDCLDFIHRKHICKHLALVGYSLFTTADERMAA